MLASMTSRTAIPHHPTLRLSLRYSGNARPRPASASARGYDLSRLQNHHRRDPNVTAPLTIPSTVSFSVNATKNVASASAETNGVHPGPGIRRICSGSAVDRGCQQGFTFARWRIGKVPRASLIFCASSLSSHAGITRLDDRQASVAVRGVAGDPFECWRIPGIRTRSACPT